MSPHAGGRPPKTGKVHILKPSIVLRFTDTELGPGEDDDLAWLLNVPPRKLAAAIKTTMRSGTPVVSDDMPEEEIDDLLDDLGILSM